MNITFKLNKITVCSATNIDFPYKYGIHSEKNLDRGKILAKSGTDPHSTSGI
jgi:hypothetical protein